MAFRLITFIIVTFVAVLAIAFGGLNLLTLGHFPYGDVVQSCANWSLNLLASFCPSWLLVFLDWVGFILSVFLSMIFFVYYMVLLPLAFLALVLVECIKFLWASCKERSPFVVMRSREARIKAFYLKKNPDMTFPAFTTYNKLTLIVMPRVLRLRGDKWVNAKSMFSAWEHQKAGDAAWHWLTVLKQYNRDTDVFVDAQESFADETVGDATHAFMQGIEGEVERPPLALVDPEEEE